MRALDFVGVSIDMRDHANWAWLKDRTGCWSGFESPPKRTGTCDHRTCGQSRHVALGRACMRGQNGHEPQLQAASDRRNGPDHLLQRSRSRSLTREDSLSKRGRATGGIRLRGPGSGAWTTVRRSSARVGAESGLPKRATPAGMLRVFIRLVLDRSRGVPGAGTRRPCQAGIPSVRAILVRLPKWHGWAKSSRKKPNDTSKDPQSGLVMDGLPFP